MMADNENENLTFRDKKKFFEKEIEEHQVDKKSAKGEDMYFNRNEKVGIAVSSE